MKVYIGSKERMPLRLIIEKVPKEIAAEKRRKLKQLSANKKKFISKKRLELCDVNIYITNTTIQQIDTKNIRTFYSLRWQIEILFKAWKSVYKIDKIKTMKIERYECINYGTLILIALTTQLLGYYKNQIYKKYKKEISEIKFFLLIKSKIEIIKNGLNSNINKLILLFHYLKKAALKTCIKQTKHKQLSSFQILLEGT